MADAKSRLTSLFQGNPTPTAQGNDALRYVAPKEPSRQQQPAPTQAAPQQTQQSTPNAIVFNTTVSLYQYDSAARKYQQMGTSASTVVGCVIVGSETTYAVLFYNADKATLCEIPVKAWKPTVQPKNYLNFYDEKGTNWSVKCASEDALTELMRQVVLAKIHIEIWSPTRSLDANTLWKEDIGAGTLKSNDNGPGISPGDTVAVEFKCWRVVGNAKAAPKDVVSKYPPFEKTNDGELRKFRVGEGAERIKALEESVVGMKRGGKRLVLAPPGKTNGQDWYLLEVTLVKTKTGGSSGSSRRESAPATSAQATERRGSNNSVSADPPASSSRSKSRRKTVNNSDLVPYDEDPTSQQAKDELELKELRLLQREKQLEMQQRELENARNGIPNGAVPTPVAGASYAFNPSSVLGGGGYSPYNSMFSSPVQSAQSIISTSGRPIDGMIHELHAKIDYLIRMAPTSNANNSSVAAGGYGVGATDVQAVIRGVERLAGENERLLLQINSQNQQYVSYEKRCEELLKQNQRLQEEKRASDEKYQSLASQHLNYNTDIASLTSARDAAITQTNRLHAEYQQLLTAFYQKQQLSTESEEQKNELNFERQARVRLEKELTKETQSKSLVEQELNLVKKQLDVFTKLRESELQNYRKELEKQLAAAKAKDHQDVEERVKKATQEHQQEFERQQQEWQAHHERQTKQFQAQVEDLQARLAATANAKQAAQEELTSTQEQVRALEASLADAVASATTNSVVSEGFGLAEEEKRIYQEQIELLQQEVKDLEAEKFARVQQDLDAGRLSPTSSPRHHKKLEISDDSSTCTLCDATNAKLREALAKQEAADRTLAMAEEIKREAQTMLANGGSSDASESRDKLVDLFKEAINEMFFRFQDVFEDEAATSLEGKQVLAVIRKVLKQSTREVIQRLQDAEVSTPEPVAAEAVSHPTLPSVPLSVAVASSAAHAADHDDGEESSDEPPPPPVVAPAEEKTPVKESPVEKAPATKPESPTAPKQESAKQDGEEEEDDEEDDDAAGDDLLFGAASVSTSNAVPVSTAAIRRPSSDDDDSDDDFED
ncbi:hypothetical protein Poli38472_001813 [Pythium oligandrum]|uniref:Uncharacterized protein n=1 Tax=Pythium oligandrum TaxID=41045 RepID=A0A8K1CVG9_PYTOL|nr:hypothetical protein Poli38472_001813 [Pythium oligandrum]|eukprot:TMW69657.1 hypothetical protein Poli38472_001813 [Pythium oligandrum]